jgi:gluconate 2-dehydrogenase gamma chain
MSITRREFVTGISGLGAVWVAGALACREKMDPEAAAHGPPPESAAPPRVLAFLTDAEAAEVEAFSARIIPTDETPGAREAGVVWFIDGALATFMRDQQDFVRGGLKTMSAAVAKAHPGRTSLAALTEPEQDAFLKSQEREPLFGFLRFGTIAGMFALPKYGGNKDYMGWALVGQEHVFEFKPPFGWYDRPENQRALLGRVL